MHKTFRLLAVAGALLGTQAQAVDFQLVSHVGDAYGYTLTYGPDDNMWWVENGHVHATIRLAGLFGVVAVTGPSSTDFPAGGPIDAGQLHWTGDVLAGGAVVVFSMLDEDVGTGNFPMDKHVFGFTLIAPNTIEGEKIVLDTNGFYSGHTLEDRDVHKLISGPIGPGGPVPEPASWAMMVGGIGLAGAALRQRRGLTRRVS